MVKKTIKVFDKNEVKKDFIKKRKKDFERVFKESYVRNKNLFLMNDEDAFECAKRSAIEFDKKMINL
jgi:hypothetical protein